MAGTSISSSVTSTCCRAFEWRDGLTTKWRIAMCLGMAGITGFLAQIRIAMPWTPVPATGQVFAVLLAGVLMGRRYGAVSQIFYVALGVAGVPWFAGWTSGAVLGPTGGYLLGFAPAAALVGYFADPESRPSRRRLILAMGAGIAVIYVCGAVQFALVMQAGLSVTLMSAVLPFIAVDLAKALLAAGIASAILPRTHPGQGSSAARSQSVQKEEL